MGPAEYNRLLGQLSSEAPEVKTYEELIALFKDTFGPTKSPFRRRHDILAFRAPPGTPAEELNNLGNLKGDEFELSNLTGNMVKIFLILQMVSDLAFKKLRALILKTVDDKPEITVNELREVTRRRISRSNDASIEGKDPHGSDLGRNLHQQSEPASA